MCQNSTLNETHIINFVNYYRTCALPTSLIKTTLINNFQLPLEIGFECKDNICLKRILLLTWTYTLWIFIALVAADARIPFYCACPSNARSRADLKRKALILSTIKNRFLPTLDLDYDKNATAWIVEPQFQFFLVQLHLHNGSKSILKAHSIVSITIIAHSYFYHAGTKHPHIKVHISNL